MYHTLLKECYAALSCNQIVILQVVLGIQT